MAQSSRPREREQNNGATEAQNDTAKQLEAIAAEIRAIREQQTKTEQREAAYEAAQSNQVYWPPNWSNWVLAGFAAVAAIVSACTLRALTKQVHANFKAAAASAAAARATRDSVQQTERHFELLNAQWLDTGEFWCELDPISDSGQPGRWDWRVDFQIRNNTPLVLTVVKIEYFVCADYAETFTQHTIGPRKLWKVPAVRIGAYPDTVAQFLDNNPNTTATIVGRIHYLNAMNKLCIQRFGKSGPLVVRERCRLKKGLDGDLEQFIQIREKFRRERQEKREAEKQSQETRS